MVGCLSAHAYQLCQKATNVASNPDHQDGPGRALASRKKRSPDAQVQSCTQASMSVNFVDVHCMRSTLSYYEVASCEEQRTSIQHQQDDGETSCIPNICTCATTHLNLVSCTSRALTPHTAQDISHIILHTLRTYV
jgi:hypothetical protein